MAAAKGKAFDPGSALQGRMEGSQAIRSEHGPWKVFARMDHEDALKAKAQAEDDLANGADGLVLTSAKPAAILAGLPLHKIAVRNEAGDEGADALRKMVSTLPLDPSRLAIDFGIQDAALARVVRSDGFASPLMKADGTMFHSEGADDAAELGCILAEALGRLRMLEFLDDAALSQAVSMKLIASQDMFGTIAKFRAARILWTELLSVCKLPQKPLSLHGETSRLMLAKVDAHSNILRASTAVFAAGLGGADSICALPFSFTQGLPNSFARRVARNSQLLLLHEAQLWRADDPAAGAGAFEQRTQAICDKAWSVMQACERGQWPSGNPSASRARPVIGVSRYPNPKSDAAEVEVLP